MAPYTARGRERVQIFSEDGIEQCACRSNCWEKSVACWTNVVHTQYILPVGAEVSSYNWQKRVLQRVALINWWNSCFYFSWYTQVYGPKTELLMPRPVGILDITGNLTLLAHLPAWHPPPSHIPMRFLNRHPRPLLPITLGLGLSRQPFFSPGNWLRWQNCSILSLKSSNLHSRAYQQVSAFIVHPYLLSIHLSQFRNVVFNFVMGDWYEIGKHLYTFPSSKVWKSLTRNIFAAWANIAGGSFCLLLVRWRGVMPFHISPFASLNIFLSHVIKCQILNRCRSMRATNIVIFA